jgi:hypothetical protein
MLRGYSRRVFADVSLMTGSLVEVSPLRVEERE